MEKIQALIAKDYTIRLDGLPLSTKLSDLQMQDETFDSLNRAQFVLDLEDLFDTKLALVSIQTLSDLVEVETKYGDKL